MAIKFSSWFNWPENVSSPTDKGSKASKLPQPAQGSSSATVRQGGGVISGLPLFKKAEPSTPHLEVGVASRPNELRLADTQQAVTGLSQGVRTFASDSRVHGQRAGASSGDARDEFALAQPSGSDEHLLKDTFGSKIARALGPRNTAAPSRLRLMTTPVNRGHSLVEIKPKL